MVLIDGIERIAGRVAIRWVDRIAGIKAVGGVDGMSRREGLRKAVSAIRKMRMSLFLAWSG